MQTEMDVQKIVIGTGPFGGPEYDPRSVLYAFRVHAAGVMLMSPWFHGLPEEAETKRIELSRHFGRVEITGGRP